MEREKRFNPSPKLAYSGYAGFRRYDRAPDLLQLHLVLHNDIHGNSQFAML